MKMTDKIIGMENISSPQRIHLYALFQLQLLRKDYSQDLTRPQTCSRNQYIMLQDIFLRKTIQESRAIAKMTAPYF